MEQTAIENIELTLSNTTNSDCSTLKEFADDNFKFDKNCRYFFKRLGNTAGKGEIAHYEQFLLFIRPSKTGRIMGSPVAGGWVGGVQFFVRSISPKLLYLGL